MEAYLLKHAFAAMFLFFSMLAGVSRIGQSDQCIGCFREVQNVRSFGTEGRTDGARGFVAQIWNLPRLILMIGLADMSPADGSGRTTGCIDCETQ